MYFPSERPQTVFAKKQAKETVKIKCKILLQEMQFQVRGQMHFHDHSTVTCLQTEIVILTNLTLNTPYELN